METVSGGLFRHIHPDEVVSGNIEDFERLASALKTLRESSVITPKEARAILKRFGWIEDVDNRS